ncbi:MAG: HAD-IA family hydrolase, partial [Chloroflexota bacterium]|nr:HAD-IA family hydrolase [Chloroflexota bacterium]
DLLAAVCREQGVALDAGALAAFGDHIAERVAARARAGRPFTFPPAESRRFWLETYRGFLARHLPAAAAERAALAYRAILSSPAGYSPFADALPVLQGLRERGLALGVVSNWEAWLPALLDATGLTVCFDHVAISGLRGVEKPDPGLFTLALAEAGYRPGEVVYVGDSLTHDVTPALALGITPVLLDRRDRYPPDPAYRRITSLRALPAALALP